MVSEGNADLVHDLQREATALKKAGDLVNAIECARKAHVEISRNPGIWGIGPSVKYPQYLHLAGRTKEAWAEFNKLLFKAYLQPNQSSEEIRPMETSQLLDKMRLFLERESRSELAAVFSSLSSVFWSVGLFRQKRFDELASMWDDECVRAMANHLQSFISKGTTGALCQSVIDAYRKFPMVDYVSLGSRLESVLLAQARSATTVGVHEGGA